MKQEHTNLRQDLAVVRTKAESSEIFECKRCTDHAMQLKILASEKKQIEELLKTKEDYLARMLKRKVDFPLTQPPPSYICCRTKCLPISGAT